MYTFVTGREKLLPYYTNTIINLNLRRPQWPRVLRRLLTGVARKEGSSVQTSFKTRCMSHFFCVVLCCIGEALRWADPPSKESYQNVLNGIIVSELILNRSKPDGLKCVKYNNNNLFLRKGRRNLEYFERS